LASAITLATFATGAAAFDASSWEVSGFVKNETAALQGSGTFHGQQSTTSEATGYQSSLNDSGDVIKFENTAKLFVNGDLTENAFLTHPHRCQRLSPYERRGLQHNVFADQEIGHLELKQILPKMVQQG